MKLLTNYQIKFMKTYTKTIMTNKQYNGTTVNDLYNALYRKFNELVDTILNYESDTFSSERSDLTPSEAEKIAITFILRDIERRNNTETMDGDMITETLSDLRDKHFCTTCGYVEAQTGLRCEKCNAKMVYKV